MFTQEKPMTSATLAGRMRAAVAYTVLAACTAVGALGSARAANANTDAPTLTVRYADLNLSTEQGSLVLYGRIVRAAQQVCAVDDIRDLRAFNAAKLCRAQAIANAVRDVNSPMLASVYAARLQHG
jgi:UrcA family protein